jgi:putative transposase
MKRSRFTEEQIIGVLKEHQAGLSAAELCRKHGISDATFYNWRSRFGGMEVSEAKRLKQLEGENAKLKKLLAESVIQHPEQLHAGRLLMHGTQQPARVRPVLHQYRGPCANRLAAHFAFADYRSFLAVVPEGAPSRGKSTNSRHEPSPIHDLAPFDSRVAQRPYSAVAGVH